jgi:hypothetical protein
LSPLQINVQVSPEKETKNNMEEDNNIRAAGNGFSMGQIQYIAKNNGRWRQIVNVFCPIGDEEDK